MTPQGENSLCPYCLERGLQNRINPVQINWKSAILLCQNPECIYPLDRQWSLIESDGKKLTQGENSVDENAFDKALKQLQHSNIEENVKNMDATSCTEGGDSKMDNETSPNAKEFPLSDNMASDLVDDNYIEALLSGQDDNSDEFEHFIDSLSNLPNASFSIFSELPASRISDIRKQHIEILKVATPPVIVLGDNPNSPRLGFLIDQRDGLSSLESVPYQRHSRNRCHVDKSEPRRYAQWTCESNPESSWLVSGLSVIVHSRIIRCVLKSSSELLAKDLKNPKSSSLISSVCSSYEMAMRKLLVALTLCNDGLETDLPKQVQRGGDSMDSSRNSFDNLTFGNGCSVSIPRLLHQRIVDHLNSCLEDVVQSLNENSSIASHPADLISYLLNSHDDLRELSVVSYRCELSCSSCKYNCVEDRASRAVTLEVSNSRANFSLNGPDCCIDDYCPQCFTVNQNTHITWLTFSPILFLHFPKGLPDACEYEKLSLSASALNISKEEIVGIDRYCVTSRGQYEIRVSAVVTCEERDGSCEYHSWVRKGSDSWMLCQEALGKKSYLAEWDPLTAPRKIPRSASSVRIILLESVPVAKSNAPQASETGYQNPMKSRLHERVINIMRERKRQLRQQSANSSICNKNVSLPDVSPATSIMQRFLNSEVEHQVMLGGKSSRFQPYPTDHRGRVANTNAKMRSESATNLLQLESIANIRSSVKRCPSSNGSISGSVEFSQTRLSETNRGSIKSRKTRSHRSLVSYDIHAASLWPIPSKFSKHSEIEVRTKKSSSSSKSSHNSQDNQNLEATVTMSYDINSTTRFLEGHSAELTGNDQKV